MRSALNTFEGTLVTVPPVHGGLFVVTMVAGSIVYNEPITAYDAAVRRAEAVLTRLPWRLPFAVKVIPMSGPEARTLGLLPDDLFANMTPDEHHEMRELVRANCLRALQTTRDPAVRADAYELNAMLGPRP